MKNYRVLYNTIVPLNEQVQLDPTKTSMSKTDAEGIIEYANEAFMNVCGFSKAELMGRPHSLVRHPDMPSVVFKLMWETISRGKGIYAIVKNMTKEGRYYWVIAKISSKFDKEGNIIAHYAQRKAAPAPVVAKIEGLYKELRAIEINQNASVAEKYFLGLLEDKELTYEEFLISIIGKEQVSLDSFFTNLTKKEKKEIKKEKPLIKKDIPFRYEPDKLPKKKARRILIDREVKVDPSRVIMSKTNPKGLIDYVNDYFLEISGYQDFELIGYSHNKIRHPDMPRTLFKLLWENLKKGNNFHALVKNLTKDGHYFWVLTNFETKYDEAGKIIAYYARTKAAPAYASFKIEKLYKTLLSIEKTQNMKVAEKYFIGFLEEQSLNYNDYLLEVLGFSKNELQNYFLDTKKENNKKKGFFGKLFD